MSKRTETLTIRLTEEEKSQLQDIASKFDLSVGFIVRRLVRAGLRDQGKQRITLCSSITRGAAALAI